ncbi:protein kinase [Streptomyces sp. 15-116A]|uniref:protein kinase domain-containing protein n=1 Tax=Streptomyces sp. 15-116A TaxID=2259035 RepID=UPI0021B2958D|nr:serine/threonine protein kinase [Streptomyces sp. 15-116A]MCT7352632.1 protein kinase [Streptomyces sp. 15-116A]
MGEVFAGRYELVDPIGRGGVGAVWRAWDHRRRRYVAAKILLQSDAHSLLRFVREQALRIDHPHVLAPTSWAADDDKVLFTMDLVAGGSLVHLVGDYGPLPPAFVCTLLDQLLAGLAAVHAEGVVHRDIKPANVLLEATGTGRPRLRLSDFGIAMRLGEPRLTETNLVVGTPGYIAPEQMMGSEPDFPADLFAVGLVALYLLEGAKPDAKALIQYFADHGTPGAPQGIPEPLWQVVSTLLQPDPAARFRTATGARKALAAAAELLPEPSPDDELIEIFDQLGPLPPGFAADGPVKRASGVRPEQGAGVVAEEARPGDAVASSGLRHDSLSARPSSAHEPSSAQGPASAQGLPSAGTAGAASGEPGPVTASGAPRQVAASGVPGPVAASGSGAGTGSVPSAVSEQPSSPPASAPPVQPQGSARSMSDTGSFHLPPPQVTAASSATSAPPSPPGPPGSQPRRQPQPQHHLQPPPARAAEHSAQHPLAAHSAHVSPHDPTHPLRSPETPHPSAYPVSAPLPPAEASTAEYTAQAPQVPPPSEATSRHAAPPSPPRRRPGPPARVAVPLLLLALACYAVGFWALTQI